MRRAAVDAPPLHVDDPATSSYASGQPITLSMRKRREARESRYTATSGSPRSVYPGLEILGYLTLLLGMFFLVIGFWPLALSAVAVALILLIAGWIGPHRRRATAGQRFALAGSVVASLVGLCIVLAGAWYDFVIFAVVRWGDNAGEMPSSLSQARSYAIGLCAVGGGVAVMVIAAWLRRRLRELAPR